MDSIQFPPGVTNLESKNAKIVNWREAHLIRWHDGVTMRPVGGWERINFPVFPSKLRKMHKWMANSGIIYTAYLCENHCFVEEGGTITNITPVDGLLSPAVNLAGYGNDKYGKYQYGNARPGDSRLDFFTPVFSLDNWGEELRAMTSADGRYLGWSPSAAPGTLLTAVTDAPINNRAFIITPERHAMLFGMGAAFDKFGWSNEEDDTNWAFADVLSRAGFYDVSPKSQIVSQLTFSSGIIMWTPINTYVIEWDGLPYTYSYRPLGKTSIPFSPASMCDTPIGVIWPSIDGWWLYDGNSVKVVPCTIWDFVVKNIAIQATCFTGACVHLANEGEVWWFYADKTATPGFNNRFAMYDYRSKSWSMGKLNRLCGYVFANDPNPIMSDGVNVWRHESGFSYEGTDMPWIESFNLNPNGGENWFTVKKILPDVSGDADAIRFRMAKTNDRNGYTPEVYSPPRTKNGSGFVDIRETARDMRLRIDMVKSADWGTVGPILFDANMRGQK